MSEFKEQENESDFLARADQRMSQGDSFWQMLCILGLLHEAAEKKFYAAQVYLIEKYTQWEVDPVMSIQREVALMFLESKRKESEHQSVPPSIPSSPIAAQAAPRSPAATRNDFDRLSAHPLPEAQCPACGKTMRISSARYRRNIFCMHCSHEYSVGP